MRHKETLEGVGYVYYHGYDDAVSGTCICQNSSNSTH